jgi:hypothetical protein
MGLFKQMKDMKNVVAAAPDMVDQAQQMQANAQQMQAAQMQAAQMGAVPGGVGGAVDPAALEPIEGISLEEYARLSKTIGTRGLDQAGIADYVQTQGHTPDAWQAAYDGWNERFKGNTALAVQYGNLYQQAAGS